MRSLAFSVIYLCCIACFAQTWSLSETVYISTGCEAYAYHAKKECYSLNECNANEHVKSTTREKAIIDSRRTPCGRCLRKEYNLWKNNLWIIRKDGKTQRNGKASTIIEWYNEQQKQQSRHLQ